MKIEQDIYSMENLMESNEKQYELVIVDDDKLDALSTIFSIHMCFPEYNSDVVSTIVADLDCNGESPVMVGTMDECKKAMIFLGEDGIPVKLLPI